MKGLQKTEIQRNAVRIFTFLLFANIISDFTNNSAFILFYFYLFFFFFGGGGG